MNALFRTPDSASLMIVRLALGIVFLPHGLQKTLGLFGGGGFSGTMSFFTGQGIPAALAFLVILAFLILHQATGLRGRLAARWMMTGYLLLTLAYPGVKFVRDVLLG